MPKKPIDFSKTIIYKISKDDDFYVGSTTDFATRKSHHKSVSNNVNTKDYNLKIYQTIRDKGGWNTWEMTPLEEYVECQNKIQARIREDEWRVKLNASLNMKRAYLSKEEHDKRHREESKIFYQNHKDKILIYRAQFYQEHADEINAKRAVKFECGCGSICRISDKARHKKSKKHQKYLATL